MKNMVEHENNDGDRELQAPPALGKALNELQKERVFIPSSVDERVLWHAKRQLRRAADRRLRVRSAARWLALAACVMVLGWLARTFVFSPNSRNDYAREDVNRDGRVDILDALALSRFIELRNAVPPTADFNGDGRIDAADVEIIARHSVRLAKGGPS